MPHRYSALLLLAALAAAHAAPSPKSHGYLLFWQHPDQPNSPPFSKTTRENATANEARAEMQAFCREHNHPLARRADGCFAVTKLTDSCAAAAWPAAHGVLTATNVTITVHRNFQTAQAQALQQCRTRYGIHAACEVETAFCSNATAYLTPENTATEPSAASAVSSVRF